MPLDVLIVDNDADLTGVWRAHLERQGARVSIAGSQEAAVDHLQFHAAHVIVLSLDLTQGSALAVADFASYRHPRARVIFVTRTRFFSDGSIFRLVPNTAAFLPARTPPEDLVALVEHHGTTPAT